MSETDDRISMPTREARAELAQELRGSRSRAGITRQELAARSGVSLHKLLQLENQTSWRTNKAVLAALRQTLAQAPLNNTSKEDDAATN